VSLLAPQHLDFIQHVDTLLYFASPTDVMLSMPLLYEDDKVAEFQNVRTLLELGYTVHRVPRRTASITYTNILTTRRHVYVPQYTRYQIESALQREREQTLVALRKQGRAKQAAALLRLPIDVETVEGGDALARENRRAVEVLAALFPNKRVVPVDSDETLTTRGSWHCLSHELPDRL
jgi:agmatine/peptidylarginine deiminase